MNAFRFILVPLFLCLVQSVWAKQIYVTVDSVRYNLNVETKEAEVEPAYTYAHNIVIAETVEYEGNVYRVTSIRDYAFVTCSGLLSIYIPNSVTSIGASAFSGCEYLTSIDIPSSVTSIGDGAFWDCKSLTSIDIPNSVTSIEPSTFYGCTGLTSVGIPNSVTSIGDYAFEGCTGLTNIDLPCSLTSIDFRAFKGCTGLTNINIPEGVLSVGSYAFYNCTALTNVNIPRSLTSIGYRAFYGCEGIKRITCLALTPPSIEKFLGSTTLGLWGNQLDSITLYVPEEAVSAYQAATCWRDFPNIVAIDAAGIGALTVTEENSPSVIFDLQGRRLRGKQKGFNIINGKKVLVQ